MCVQFTEFWSAVCVHLREGTKTCLVDTQAYMHMYTCAMHEQANILSMSL